MSANPNREKIIAALVAGPRDLAAIAAVVGCSEVIAQRYVQRLVTEGTAVPIRAIPGRGARQRVLYELLPERRMSSAINTPRQASVSSYPPVNRRDPLVAALFGAADAALHRPNAQRSAGEL